MNILAPGELSRIFERTYTELEMIPPEMNQWNMSLRKAIPTEYGVYVLVECLPSPIEQQHVVKVIGEDGLPLDNVNVMFGFGTGKSYGFNASSAWRDKPAVIKGDAQRTVNGIARHTTGDKGGEDIWIHNIERNGMILLSSDMVGNCTIAADTRYNMHTGVMLTFQRRVKVLAPQWFL
jgi:hypothetical protein